MGVSGVGDSSLMNQLAGLGSSFQADNLQVQYQAMAFKQIKNIEESQAQLMAKLMESMPLDPAVGNAVNISA